jgi:acetyltransferase-like isoleucine patch superfamily enzyme
MIGPNTVVGHDSKIGDYCTLCAQCDITGGVVIKNEVLLGSRVSIIPRRTIGNKSILGAGAVIISNVPDEVTMVGNPARIL